MKAFHYQFQIPFHQVDAAGILFFAHVFTHAHDAYAAFMAHLGWPLKALLDENTLAIPLGHAAADYHHPLHLDERVQIQLGITAIGVSSFSCRHDFLVERQLCVRVSTRHVCIDPATASKIPVPDELKMHLNHYRSSR